jgi:hypothetical protein
VRDVLCREKAKQDAARIRDAIIEGYEDAIASRVVPFEGDLRGILARRQRQ